MASLAHTSHRVYKCGCAVAGIIQTCLPRRTGSSFKLLGRSAHLHMGDARSFVDGKIAERKVIMFCKTYCPACKKAKDVFDKYLGTLLPEDDYEAVEIETLPNCEEIQDYLMALTGGRTVPRIFINQKFIGGGDEVVALDKTGELKVMLAF